MHYGDWQNGPGDGSWMWVPMMLMMIVFWGGLIAVAIAVIRRPHHSVPSASLTAGPGETTRHTPQEILAERLARGEIDPDDYRNRLEALDHPPDT